MHYKHGMLGSLKIQGDKGKGDLPKADASVKAKEYGFDISGLKAGANTVSFENTGQQFHHALFIPMAAGATLDDVKQFLASNGPPPEGQQPPVDFEKASGFEVLAPGNKVVQQSITLEKGSYVVLCFLSDKSGGPPHFIKGMLQHDHGVKPQDMHWFMGGLNTFVEPPLIALDLPKDIRLDFLSGAQTLERMFAAGELDALLSLYIPKLFLDGSRTIARLFPNYKEVEQDYYRRTRILPIMHTVALREDLHRQHPWAARSIYRAFGQARDLAVGGLYDTDARRAALAD